MVNILSSPQKLIQASLDLLFPPACVHCKTSDVWLCQNCRNAIDLITTTVCERCGTPNPADANAGCKQCQNNPLQYLDGIRSAAYFEDNPIRSAVHAFKYRDRKVVAPALAEILADAYSRYAFEADVVMPVPLHPTRLKERGYNQSELIAKELGRLLELPVDVHTLCRTRQTRSQMTLKADERRQNVVNAFACRRDLVYQKVLLVDDVCTTGSTLEYCAMALKTNGTTSVWGLTLAKAR